MNNTIRIDKAGRVVIPHAVRKRYGLLEGGARLEVRESAEGIVLKPLPEEVPAERHSSGWVVFHTGKDESVDPSAAVDEERERRHQQVRGER